MKTLAGIAVLMTVAVLSLACSSGEETSDFAENAFGRPIPFEVRASFVQIPGGTLTNLHVPIDEDFFNSLDEEAVVTVQENLEGYGTDVGVTSFSMMDSEVTIRMYADFMNSVENNFESLLADDTETIVNSLGQSVNFGITSFTRPSETIYKPVMQDASACGIYMFNEFDQDVSGEILVTSGFTLTKPTAEGEYVDPVSTYVSKPRGVTKNLRFEVAPGRDQYPMVFLSRTDAKQFARWMGTGFRLPTVLEYQYAGRGGGEVDFATSTGDIYVRDSNNDIIYDSFGRPSYLANIQGEFTVNNGSEKVKSFPPNPYGLYDLTGNVYEWTVDPFEDNLNTATASGGQTPTVGGSFASTFLSAGSTWAVLTENSEGLWATDLGFRVIYTGESATLADAEWRFYGISGAE